MDAYQQFIALSRYARWLPDEQRRETWEESVQRYLDHFGITDQEIQEAITNLHVMPSMRAIMTAGKALEKDAVSGYNPVSGDSLVVTKEHGNVPISQLSGQRATVLNKDGNWCDASFKSYGVQETKEVTLRLNSNTVKKVKATDNHRWVLEDGRVVPTSSLNKGDRINFVSAPKAEIDDDYLLGVRHGIIYGDGTAVRSCGRVKGYHIRLCGKSAEFLRYFKYYPVTYPPSANGDPVVMLYDGFAATHALKELPRGETDSYLLGFVRGWLAADGSVTKTSQVSLCTSGEGKDWLLENAEKIGFVIQRVAKQPSETNYGKRNQDSFVLYISRSSCSQDDFLASWKRQNFRPLKSYYSVASVEDSVRTEVFCANVPDTNTFVLQGGLVTGNCSFVAVDHPRVFDEVLYILMCGTGVGFSVERQFINKLPEVSDSMHETDTTIQVRDSKLGWATAFRELISMLYAGRVPSWDTSRVRPAGARLKTFGGRASGPGPLEDLFQFTINLFNKAKGRKLNSLECHDLLCKVADIVVAGGVRRSALISLSNLSDDRMRACKSGEWWNDNPQRALANNSACYTEKPDFSAFLKEWVSLYESRSGERGIFSRVASQKQAAKNGRRDATHDFGTNPL